MNLDNAFEYIKSNMAPGLNVIIGPDGAGQTELIQRVGQLAETRGVYAFGIGTHMDRLRRDYPEVLTRILDRLSEALPDTVYKPEWSAKTLRYQGVWGEPCYLADADFSVFDMLNTLLFIMSPLWPRIGAIPNLGAGYNPIHAPKIVRILSQEAVAAGRIIVATTCNTRVLDGLDIATKDRLFLLDRLKDEDKKEIRARLCQVPRPVGSKEPVSLGEAWACGYLCG